ncbi:MAG: tetratricopeptide repeat protein, partial [Phycisphaeraceae bacterium]|nr:tetratricopeptide repeat protein [Phycisphaeraceae bacterium]
LLLRLLPYCVQPGILSPTLRDWLATSLTLLWVLHPVQTECVLYITQRSEQFSMLFMVLTFYCLIRGHTHRRWLILSVLSCTVGMLFKQNAAVFPIILVLFDRALLTGSFKQTFKLRGKFYLLTTAVTWSISAIILVYTPNPKSVGTHLGVSSWEYLITQSQVILWYLRNCFWPTGLSLVYDWPIVKSFSQVIPEFLSVSSLFALSCYCLWKYPKLGVGFFSVFLLLGPTSSVLPMASEVAADRRLSLISIFLLVTAVLLLLNTLASLPRVKRYAAILTLSVTILGCAIFSLMTAKLSTFYGNPVALWTHTIDQSPWPKGAWLFLGEYFDSQNELAPAWQCYTNTLKYDSHFTLSYLNLATVNLKLNRYPQAIHFLEKVTHDPALETEALQYLGIAYKNQKMYDKAITYFQKAHTQAPDRYDFALNLARVYNLKKHHPQAREILEQTAQIHSNNLEVIHELGFTYSKLNALDKAGQQYAHYLQLDPNNAMVLNSMGIILAKTGKIQEAATYFARSLSINPNFEQARENLANARSILNTNNAP